jgi:ketosteroid isomerase-like protein
MKPKQWVQRWVESFNNADAEALSQYYTKDPVNYQVADSVVYGRAAIRAKFEEEFSAGETTCIVENIFEDGDWAILEWKDPLGLRE